MDRPCTRRLQLHFSGVVNGRSFIFVSQSARKPQTVFPTWDGEYQLSFSRCVMMNQSASSSLDDNKASHDGSSNHHELCHANSRVIAPMSHLQLGNRRVRMTLIDGSIHPSIHHSGHGENQDSVHPLRPFAIQKSTRRGVGSIERFAADGLFHIWSQRWRRNRQTRCHWKERSRQEVLLILVVIEIEKGQILGRQAQVFRKKLRSLEALLFPGPKFERSSAHRRYQTRQTWHWSGRHTRTSLETGEFGLDWEHGRALPAARRTRCLRDAMHCVALGIVFHNANLGSCRHDLNKRMIQNHCLHERQAKGMRVERATQNKKRIKSLWTITNEWMRNWRCKTEPF